MVSVVNARSLRARLKCSASFWRHFSLWPTGSGRTPTHNVPFVSLPLVFSRLLWHRSYTRLLLLASRVFLSRNILALYVHHNVSLFNSTTTHHGVHSFSGFVCFFSFFFLAASLSFLRCLIWASWLYVRCSIVDPSVPHVFLFLPSA